MLQYCITQSSLPYYSQSVVFLLCFEVSAFIFHVHNLVKFMTRNRKHIFNTVNHLGFQLIPIFGDQLVGAAL